MNVIMSGVDHRLADVARRECFALSADRQRDVFTAAAGNPAILGIVILSTCNRTELYLSLQEDTSLDPFSLIGAENEPHETHQGEDCFFHLAQLSCGAMSRIFGEDQILAQVKAAVATARQHHALDNVLEVFFRQAVTSAKRVKTELRFSRSDNNVAAAARNVLRESGDIRSVLVIGNGEIGRLAARTLRESGYRVTMTLRQYRHTEAVIPDGVSIITYDDRYDRMGDFDAVLSATASPHCTILAERLAELPVVPRVFIDLAMPRDIDPKVGELPDTVLYDIDTVSDRASREAAQEAAVAEMLPLLQDGYRELLRWNSRREELTEEPSRTHFPLFVSCTGKRALVVGGGRIAARRVRTLASFTFDITVVAPEIRDDIRLFADAGRIDCLERPFEESDLDDVFLVVAATDDRQVNHRIASLARHRGIFASIADERDECSFFFPGIAQSGRVTVGVCGDGSSHHDVAAAAKKIREVLHDEATGDRKP